MKNLFTFSKREVVLTALVVIPASAIWITTERTWIALAVGCAVFGAYTLSSDEAFRDRIVQGFSHIFSLVQSFVTRKAQA